jgi:predicted nuclease of predicted toxin-antitoxin system
MDICRKKSYAIVTFDANFYDFSRVWGYPPRVIWLRIGNRTTKEIEPKLRKYEEAIKHFSQNEELACLEIID